tara:strand:- start:1845 stop:3362 length:1518 start_codon:yes stop_codon:yes gene_type:complete
VKDKPFHPFLFGIFPPLMLFTNNISAISAEQLIVPIGIILGTVIIFFLSLKPFIKNSLKIGLIVSLALILFFSYGHVFDIIDNQFTNFPNFEKHGILLVVFLIIMLIGLLYLFTKKIELENITKIVNGISITLIVLVLFNIGQFYVQEDFSVTNDGNQFSQKILVENDVFKKPNIYYIIPDAYANSKTLQDTLDFDNTKFLSYLENQGFYIPSQSYANYASTFLSVASSLNMEYINYFSDLGLESKNRQPAAKLTNQNNIMDFLKSNGYTIINFDSGAGATRFIDSADVNLCGKNTILQSEFMMLIIRSSILNPIYVSIFEDDKRERILCALEKLPTVNQQYDEPIFVFAHMNIPHPPYLFGPNGEFTSPETLESGLENYVKSSYLNQIKFVNKKMIEVVDQIFQNNNGEFIIIIQSDHGSAFTTDWENPNKDMLLERMGILNAYYISDPEQVNLYDTITPVNSFRTIFNGYFDSDFKILDDQIFFSNYERPFDFKNVTDQLIED